MDRFDAERAAATRILALAAPTLEALALVVSCPYSAPPLIGELFATPYPRLGALAIHGFYPSPRGADNASPTLPKLTRLRLSGNRNPHGLFTLGGLASAVNQFILKPIQKQERPQDTCLYKDGKPADDGFPSG